LRISEGEDLRWIPVAPNPLKAAGYPFRSSGTLESAWIYGSLADIRKYWHEVKLFAENLQTGAEVYDVTITMHYRTDTATEWRPVTDVFDSSPSEKHLLSSAHDVTGRRWQYRLTLNGEGNLTPRVTRALVEAVMRVPPKRGWSFTFYVADDMLDLNADQIHMTAKAFADQLRAWANSELYAAPLTLRHRHAIFDNVRVFVDPASLAPLEQITLPERTIRLLGRMTLTEA
jgi:hypothetical protein